MATSKKSKPADAARKSREKGPRLSIDEVPEVQEFLDIKQKLDELRIEHPDVFMVYADLVDRYNALLEKADNTVRSLEVSCGPFENFSVSHSFDAEKMYDELGEATFLAVGGKVGQRAYYEVDSATVTAAIAAGKVPEESIENFMTVKRSYRGPKKITS